VLVIELPISFIIFYLNSLIVGTGYQLFTGPQEIVLNCLLMVFYGGYYTSMLQRSAPPKPLWQHLGALKSSIVSGNSATSQERP
jgi:hypothetical protein